MELVSLLNGIESFIVSMIKKTRTLLKSENNKRLLSNFFSLSVLQVANFILPLLTIPYLIRVLGIESFGLLAFATATIIYFQILSDYGFNLSATREVSIYRDNYIKLNEIFSSVISIKLLFFLFGLIILTILIFTFEKFREHYEIFYLTFGVVLGQSIFPIWFFQGMEKMKYISILNITAKSIFTVLIFVFVTNENDIYLVPLFQSLGFLTSGVISLYIVKKYFLVKYILPTKENILFYLKDGWHIFISRIAVVLYTSSNIFILGLFTNNTIVGYYSIAEKIISAGSMLGSITNQVLFPYLSRIWNNKNMTNYFKKIYYAFLLVIIPMLAMGILIFSFSHEIITLVSGKSIEESEFILKILAITVILFPLGGFFTQNLIIQKENSYVTKITLFTMGLNMFSVFFLIKLFGAYGLAYTVIIVQIFQVLYNTKIFFKLKGNL